MDTVTLNPKVAKRMLARAFLKIVEKRTAINAKNEFPVPDRDTGTNMCATLGGALSEVREKEYGLDFQSFCNDIEEGLSIAISGNAGTISAAFLSGFLAGLVPYTHALIGRQELYQGFWKGKECAVKSVHDPKEGTILDVIHAAENGARMCNSEDVHEMFALALRAAKEDLPRTMERNPMQKRAGKEDAGAFGFVLLLEGLYEGMFSDEEVELPEELFTMSSGVEVRDVSEDTNLENPYEVQFILEPSGGIPEVNEFRHELGKLGDSLDVFTSANGASLRVHVHVKDVEAVQRLAEKYGDASHVRVIDMREEIKAQRGEKRKVMIVTDAGADLPWSMLAQGVLVVPFKLNFPERSKLTGTFYERILQAKEWPSTSQPSKGAFAKVVSEALRLAEEVLVITISSKFSGSYNSATQAVAESFGGTANWDKVVVFDSGQAACGQALMVHKALELAQSDKSVLEIFSYLNELKDRIKLFGYPRDVVYLIRGGRLRGGKAKIASAFQKVGVHPKLCLKAGEIKSAGLSFGSDFARHLFRSVLGNLPSRPPNSMRFAVSYAGIEEELVSQLEQHLVDFQSDKLTRFTKREIVCVEPLNRVIGVHSGPALLLAWYGE